MLTQENKKKGGWKLYESAKLKIAEYQRNKIFTKEWKENISKAKKGIPNSKAHNEKVRLANLGKKASKETKEKMSASHRLEKHWNWQGGKSKEIYPDGWNYKLKSKIRKIYNYTCQYCQIKEKDSNWSLEVHHIDYNKQNLNLENFVLLCKSCHSRCHGNKNWWKKFYQEMRPQCLQNNRLLKEKLI